MIQNKKQQKGLVPSRRNLPTRRREEKETSPLFGRLIKSSLIGLTAATICAVSLITLASAMAYANPDPTKLINILSSVVLMLSNFAGGLVTSKKLGEAPLLCGIVTGGITMLASMLLEIILSSLPTSGYEFWLTLILRISAIFFSILGAFAGNVKRSTGRAKRRFG